MEAIRALGAKLKRTPSRREFLAEWGGNQRQLSNAFDTWNEAVAAAGFAPNVANLGHEPEALLADWGRVVRELRRIPTAVQFRRVGQFSQSGLEKRFGSWTAVPDAFRAFAGGKPEWDDVLALLPLASPAARVTESANIERPVFGQPIRHAKLNDRPTYGNPIDFRGLRHEPVNEQGVVFLFGMVARELGYHVEAIQQGFPDCEAKRQVREGSWQRVRIEFEYESRNFRDHGHAIGGADIIVCWRHNWPDVPPGIEVVELSSIIRSLGSSED